jgi:hypothetical protein
MADETKKWKLVEKVVAAAFDEQNVTVERNVRLRSLRRKGGNGGFREIDVLITGELIGQKIHFAVECKHYKRKVDSHHIDGFIGKLQDVGLPTQTSIFVATRGFTTQAIERAHEVGMKTLILKEGFHADEKAKILGAIQSHIFLLCSIVELVVSSSEPFILEYDEFKFFNNKGQFLGLLPDFIWASWIRGTPPAELGEFQFSLKIRDEARFLEDGTQNPVSEVLVKCQVSAVLKQFKGEASRLHLFDVHSNQTERYRISANFSDSAPVQHIFQTEAEMQKFLAKDTSIAKIQFPRLLLPKIAMNHGMLWPVNSEVFEVFKQKRDSFCEGDFIELAKSSINNFCTFDPLHIEMMNNMRNYTHLPFEVEPRETRGRV